MPPQDAKWHKVSLSGEDTKWHKVCQLVSFVMFVTMATTKTVYKAVFMLIKKVVKEIVVFGKLFQTFVVSMAISKRLCFTLIRMGATTTTTNLGYYLGQLWFP